MIFGVPTKMLFARSLGSTTEPHAPTFFATLSPQHSASLRVSFSLFALFFTLVSIVFNTFQPLFGIMYLTHPS